MGLINIFKPLSTFLLPAPLINLSNINNFSSEIILGMRGIKPWGAGWEASMLPQCNAAPHPHYNIGGYKYSLVGPLKNKFKSVSEK